MIPYPDPPGCDAHVPPGPLSAVRNGVYYTATVEREGDLFRGWP